MKLSDIKKRLPAGVLNRFKELDKDVLSGKRKKWVLKNSEQEFKPFDNFEETVKAVQSSPVTQHVAKKIIEHG